MSFWKAIGGWFSSLLSELRSEGWMEVDMDVTSGALGFMSVHGAVCFVYDILKDQHKSKDVFEKLDPNFRKIQ